MVNSLNNSLTKSVNKIKNMNIEDDPGKHPYVLIIAALIGILFILYAVYNYMTNKYNTIVSSSSFYGTNIAKNEPVFKSLETNITDCINKCNRDLSCDGITFNSVSNECIGTKDGIYRVEPSNLSSWIKNPAESEPFNPKENIIVGYAEKSLNIKPDKIATPLLISNFAYSIVINIADFYANQGKWRHIFHKGIRPDIPTIEYIDWETLISNIPEQCIGLWLAPFTNNLRIAVDTTVSGNTNSGYFDDAMVLKCNINNGTRECYITDLPGTQWKNIERRGDGSTIKPQIYKNLEYIDHDLTNIPINKPFVLTVNFIGNVVEIYINGKLSKTAQLEGLPNWNNYPVYVMNNTTFGGNIANLIYYPKSINLDEVKKIVSLSNTD